MARLVSVAARAAAALVVVRAVAGAPVAAPDPRCAMAYWGVAMSRLHQLWAPPSPADLRAGLAAVERADSLGAPTERERGYIAAVGAFYREHDRLDHLTRLRRYEE